MSKGVVSAIWPDENMPVDQNGIRADLVQTPASVINRMNPSQMYEQFWNRVGVQVIRNIKQQWLGGYFDDSPREWIEDVAFRENWKEAHSYLMGFFNDFRPAYAQFINETFTTDNERKLFLEDCLNEGLFLISGFVGPVDPQHIIDVAKKYGVESTPVTYKEVDPITGEERVVTTRKPAMIGSKYLILLDKIPADFINAVSVGYVSQHELPIKPKSKHMKNQSVISLTPMKFGEDETCMLNMSVGGDKVARFYAVHSTAPQMVKEMAKKLVTEYYPTQILGLDRTTQDIIDHSQTVSMLLHMLCVCGYDCRETKD